jgi:hypothetical protein
VGVATETSNTERDKRCRALSQLLGIGEPEAGDMSITGRLTVIAKIKAAKHAEIERGKVGSWLYDVNRHLNLCAALRSEYEALEEFLAAGDAALQRRRRVRGIGEAYTPAR